MKPVHQYLQPSFRINSTGKGMCDSLYLEIARKVKLRDY